MIVVRDRAPRLILREESAADQDFVRNLYHRQRAAEIAPLHWPASAGRAFLDNQLRLQSSHFETLHPAASRWIVESEGTPAGRFYVDRSAASWHLIEIGLLAEHRSAGTGTALIRWLFARAREGTAHAITLYVANDNSGAAALYARLGFTDIMSDSATHRRMRWRPS